MEPSETGCHSCEQEARFGELPSRERVAFDAWWRVAHAFDTALPGWLVLVPRRHVVSIAELTGDEAGTLGTWQVALARALREVTGCTKTYVAQFAEREGFAHVHFHIVPRPPDLAAELRGPGAFAMLGRPEGERVTAERMDASADALRAVLGADPGRPAVSGRPA
ncbi:HIT family protein [Embleya scabrispora]|uniref:HIT family protein n=1 Tax=Embleya scabrispora TaxID=159449 RepID=UPI000369DA5B|nr:HIT family protein [Embleya scabrispora]MYS83367.1 HIT family protein [Streptomyces sp. SID5474]